MKINEMPSCETPRERMRECGARALSNAELLAIILRTGTPKTNVVEMARDLLAEVGGHLVELSEMNMEGMWRIPGIGKSKAMQVAAAMELARRLSMERNSTHGSIESPQDAFRNCAPLYKSHRSEESWCIFLKNNRKVLGSMLVSCGGESMTSINTKSIVRKALDMGAKAVILSHNHPSGDPDPSKEDIAATEHLDEVLRSVEISLMDHIIISEQSYFSFATQEKYYVSGKNCKKM